MSLINVNAWELDDCNELIFGAYLNECTTSMVIKGGLAPDAVYTYDIVDPRFFGPRTHYVFTTTTDNEGRLTVDFSRFEQARFSSVAGAFLLKIYDEAGDVVELTLGGHKVKTVEFRFCKIFGETTSIKILQ
jgi:hypothetical protein